MRTTLVHTYVCIVRAHTRAFKRMIYRVRTRILLGVSRAPPGSRSRGWCESRGGPFSSSRFRRRFSLQLLLLLLLCAQVPSPLLLSLRLSYRTSSGMRARVYPYPRVRPRGGRQRSFAQHVRARRAGVRERRVCVRFFTVYSVRRNAVKTRVRPFPLGIAYMLHAPAVYVRPTYVGAKGSTRVHG